MLPIRQSPNQNVSRETIDRIDRYGELLKQWQKTINLVAPGDINHLQSRHIDDAAQLAPLVTAAPGEGVIDIGSGGGLPGMVLAVLLPDKHVTLIESDRRKAAFLTHCAATLQLGNVTVRAKRAPLKGVVAGCVTARAVAKLDALLDLAAPMLEPGGICVFPKGEGWAKEVEHAKSVRSFKFDALPSVTEPGAAILVIRELG